MGVPALFRWLSKKYPKIVLPVVEEEETNLPNGDGTSITIPIDISKPNPNDTEFDNLYLDMNGIVHPCTHPEGKPAPETEEDMMVEIFSYTERVVNMIRPRKLLFMAIDGVAPRAKMNQQRSRRFRSSQEAKEKEEARKEAVAMFEALGQTVSDETKNKKAWDSNAITPGTPFMDLLASSLRYWVTQKINSDPGWKNLQVILSDASVPGEGEHKIMDFIRRQRTNPSHDPNTRHVIYGLDADLIMLSLATHEPHFRVLREDVFFQEGSKTACRICGQEGHYAAQCTGAAKPKLDENDVVKKTPEKKPFIFLDVSILREYLEVELNIPQAPFGFDLERSIDDWVLLIFFVGNDFLPHLPSLEIREGAIDTLLKIWKEEMWRMGGYLTNHGHIELPRLEIILEGLAKREDDIFRRRREAEQRQDQNAKRRKIEENGGNAAAVAAAIDGGANGKKEVEGSMRMGETTYIPVEVSKEPPIHPSLPQRPAFNIAPPPKENNNNGAPAAATATTTTQDGITLATNHDVVANRRAIRLANMNAAEMLKAELAGKATLKSPSNASTPSSGSYHKPPPPPLPSLRSDETIVVPHVKPTETDVAVEPPPILLPSAGAATTTMEYNDYANMDVLPGLGGPLATEWGQPVNEKGIDPPSVLSPPIGENQSQMEVPADVAAAAAPPPDLSGLEDVPMTTTAAASKDPDEVGSESMDTDVSAGGLEERTTTTTTTITTTVVEVTDASLTPVVQSPHGVKRKLDEVENEEGSGIEDEDEEPPDATAAVATRKVNPDGTVEQEDTVRLWAPGYKERYYEQKFGVPLSDIEFRKTLTQAYVEGLSWVLHYYYQGTPSWQWYYPYHFAPFASDFEDVSKMDIKFEIGQPFKAFEQLMGVFPAASRQHIPEPFHGLMLDEDSPIIDFYPSTFEIDMNGKKMAWQGVALLPFIDEKRLLDAMAPRLSMLTDEEVRRNKWGSNVLFVGNEHALHPFISGLYVKRKSNDAITLDIKLSKGIAGSILPDPQCIPDSTYFSPFIQLDLPDIPDNRSISALYYYPRQLKPHRSQLLPGIKRSMRVLTSADFETLHRRGGRGRDGGGYGAAGRGVPYNSNNNHGSSTSSSYGGPGGGYDRSAGYGYGYGSYGNNSGPSYSSHHHHQYSSNGTMSGRGGGGGGGGGYGSSYGSGRGYGQQSGHNNNGTNYGYNSNYHHGTGRGNRDRGHY